MNDFGVFEAMQKGDWDGAITACQKALLAQPTNAKWHGYLGLCHFKKNQFDKAVDPLRRAILLDPEFVDAGTKLAQAFDRLGRYVEAHQTAEEFLRLKPSDRTLQGLVYQLQDHRDKAQTADWERTRRLDHVQVRLASEDGESYVMKTETEAKEMPDKAVIHFRPVPADGLI